MSPKIAKRMGLIRGIYALRLGNIQFLFKFAQCRSERGLPGTLALVINSSQDFVGHLLTSRALSQFVSREPFEVGRRVRKLGSFEKRLAGSAMVMKLVAQENAEAPVKHGAFRIVLDAAVKKIPPEPEILALAANTQCLAGLRGVLECGGARVPRHVPCGHIPIEGRPGLKGSHCLEQACHSTPFRPLPRRVRLDPEIRRQGRSEAAQSGQEAQLAGPRAQFEEGRGTPQPVPDFSGLQGPLQRHPGDAKCSDQCEGHYGANHSSLPAKMKAATAV